MALRNPKRFGLEVGKEFADTADKNVCLRNLNLPIFDLDTIRGSEDAGAQTHDFVSFSRLKVPIHKTTRRFSDDSSVFTSRLNDRAGISRILFGNLDINGRLSGNAIRYRYVDFAAGNAIKIADISTSRASAWSSTVPEPIPNTAPISFGAEVKTIGDLFFGTQTTVAPFANKPRLQTSQTPLLREFKSELPTHKMKVTIGDGTSGGNKTYDMFLMKGIPIIFRGFFRSLSASIGLNLIPDGQGGSIPASWKIVERSRPQNYVNFEDEGAETSSISFSSSVGKERLIQIYYNPDRITSISLTSANISALPAVKFSAVKSINLSSNRLQIFPDLNDIAPIVETLNLSNNEFQFSEIASERRLVASTVSKIPTTVKTLNLSSSFGRSSVDPHVFADRLTTTLESFTLQGIGIPDDFNPTSPFPTVGENVKNYDVGSSDFRTVVKDLANDRYSFEDLDDLETLNIGGNYYTSGQLNIVSSKLITVSFYNVGFKIPNMPNAASTLQSFNGVYMRAAGTFFNVSNNYKFANFNELTSLAFDHSSITGPFPVFSNLNLSTLGLYNTRMVGGTIDGDTSHVIAANTFASATKLTSITIQSSSLLQAPIHQDAFANLSELRNLYIHSYQRITGAVPNLGGCANLSSLQLMNNAFTGSLPSLNALSNLRTAYLNHNNFTGTVPVYKNLSSLYRLHIHNNQLTALSKFTNLPNLTYFYAHNNQMAGDIPSFADCPNLYYLILFNNQFTSYVQGSFSTLYKINYMDLSGNSLTQQAVDDILADLLTNYNSVNRGRVTVNLRGNAIPSEAGQEVVEILRSKGWTVTTS